MRKAALAIFALSLAGCAGAPPRPPATAALRLIPPPQGIGTGRVVFDCAFDGSLGDCDLDTGAGDKIAVPADDFFSDYPAADEARSHDGLGERRRAHYIRVQKLELGGVDFGPLSAKRVDRAPQPIPRLIGPQALARRGFSMNFELSRELVVDGPAPDRPWQWLALDSDKHLLIDAAFGAEPMRALFDTGAGITYVDRDYAAAHKADLELVGYLAVAGRPDEPIYRAAALTIGGRRFEKVEVVPMDFAYMRQQTEEPKLSLLLGYNVITRADWHFDLARKKWSVSPSR